MKINQKPWLSAIVPVYNAEKYLAKCIDSILMQSFSDFELILVDDGSNDGSGLICSKYAEKDDRVRYLLKENGGSIQTRAFGVEHSSGEYFTFCDADDYYASNRSFETIYNEIVKNDYDVLQFCYIKKYNHLTKKSGINKRAFADRNIFYNNEYPKLLCSFWDEAKLTTNVWNKVYRKELKANLPSHESFEQIFWGDDLIMNLYLLEQCRSILFIPDCLYIYRQFSGGTGHFSNRTMHDLNKIKEYQLQFIDRYQGKKKNSIISTCFMEIAGWLFSYAKQGLSAVGEAKTKKLIAESLELPCFKVAREYYLHNSHVNNKWVELLKLADANEYITKAKEENSEKSIKSSFISILKWIYKTI